MSQSIPAGLNKKHILLALADLDAGMAHPFGKATGFDLVHDGKQYAPKAVIGLACRHSIGRILQPDEFSGGEAPGQANFVLRKLGFTVIEKAEQEEATPKKGEHWSEQEVQLIVADYFSMLESELQGVRYNKTEHRNILLPSLRSRTKGSVEKKHQNISGVLIEKGLPYIDGYKPLRGYQALLAEEVESYLERNPGFLDALAKSPALNPADEKFVGVKSFDDVIQPPPDKLYTPRVNQKPWLSRRPRKIDFAELDAANRRLGQLGEQFVLELEKSRLNLAGRDDLAKKVLWASKEIGDGLGFDIISFDEADESERLLEVKTTGLGKFFPFYVTGNEVRCSEDVTDKYNLYRVFGFAKIPQLYILTGSLRELCTLDPVLYRALI